MSVLIINGSPRADGTVARILHIIEAEAERRGCKTAFIDTASLSFASCTGCMACRSKGACVLPHDDAHVIAEQVRQCNAVAVGTPVYWGGMSGDLKRLFDRERQAKKCAEALASKAGDSRRFWREAGVRRFGFCGRKMR